MRNYRINVFISHSWGYSEHYKSLSEWIFNEKWTVEQARLNLTFCDHSVPRDNPVHKAPAQRALQEAIFNKVKISHVVVIPTGMYVNYSDWIEKEIVGANQYGKPILAVNPWGNNAPLVLCQVSPPKLLAGIPSPWLKVFMTFIAQDKLS